VRSFSLGWVWAKFLVTGSESRWPTESDEE
jgi:hypothetical protein